MCLFVLFILYLSELIYFWGEMIGQFTKGKPKVLVNSME